MYNDEGNEAYSEEDYINAVHSIAEEIGDKKLEGRVYISLGCEYNSRGDFRKAVEFYQQGLAIAKTVGDPGGGTPIHYLYGYVPPNGVVILKLLI